MWMAKSFSTWVVYVSFQLSEYLVCSVPEDGDRQTVQPRDPRGLRAGLVACGVSLGASVAELCMQRG